MSSTGRPSEDERIASAAAAWFSQRDGGLTASEERQLAAWLAADPRHRAALARLELTWETLKDLRDYRPETRLHPDPDLLAPKARRFPRNLPVWMGMAAALTVAVGAAIWLRKPATAPAAPGQVYATTEGGYQRVNLPDGSSVELNGGSEIRVAFTPTDRGVTLLRGQSYFTVAKDPSRPFRVRAAGVTVQAVGTAFSVQQNGKQIEVLVTAGAVEVQAREASGPRPLTAAPLTAGWRAMLPADGSARAHLEQTPTETMRQLLAWQSSRLFFAEMPLAEVVQQFNQRNSVQLAIADPELGKTPIGGSFDAANVHAFVRLLTSSGDVIALEQDGDRIELRRPAR